MPRFLPALAFALILAFAGCRQKPDAVVAAFGNNQFITNQLVFYASGKCEQYGSVKDGKSLATDPARTGTFLGSSSNYVVTFTQGGLRGKDPRQEPKVSRITAAIKLITETNRPVRKVYRIIKHDGVEYVFDESSLAFRTYEESKDSRELLQAWRRE